MQEHIELFKENFGENTEAWPKNITIASWSVLHEASKMSNAHSKAVEEVYKQAREFVCDLDKPAVLGFDDEKAVFLQKAISAFCGGKHFELRSDGYQSISFF